MALGRARRHCRLFGADVPYEGEERAGHRGAFALGSVLYLAMTFGWTGAPGSSWHSPEPLNCCIERVDRTDLSGMTNRPSRLR